MDLKKNRVLVVDDDAKLTQLLSDYLQPEGFTVESARDGAAGLEKALSGGYDIVVLDVMLPIINGFEALRRIRAAEPLDRARLPVLMLTARGDDVDRIRGLDVGADDYLPKPFNPRELLARMNAVLRRTSVGSGRTPFHDGRERIRIGDLAVDVGARTVRRAGEEIELTAVEFDLLEALVRAAGHVVRREELARRILGRDLSPFDRSLDMHVSKLRRKIRGRMDDVERIKTVRGVGYLYTNPAESVNE